jgi:hypothetical protein
MPMMPSLLVEHRMITGDPNCPKCRSSKQEPKSDDSSKVPWGVRSKYGLLPIGDKPVSMVSGMFQHVEEDRSIYLFI